MVSDPSKSWCPWGFGPQGQKGAKTGVLYDLEASHLLRPPCWSWHSLLLDSQLRCGHFKTKSNKIGLQEAELLLPEVMTYVVRQQRTGDWHSMTNAVRQQRTEGVKEKQAKISNFTARGKKRGHFPTYMSGSVRNFFSCKMGDNWNTVNSSVNL